ncbi:MAG: asparagine synthase-related protein [Desulfurococcales archaeon]|nr:asparagine synthase-related protein [Desulfurococcales archaeon]
MVLGVEKPECMRLRRYLNESASKLVKDCDCSLLSGGIDTTYVISSHANLSNVTAYTVALPGSLDLEYAVKSAVKLGVYKHIVLKPSIEDYIEAVKWVIGKLVTINPVEVSADASHYLALTRALEDGCNCILSGDGGDELFLGYSFLFPKTDYELKKWIKRMVIKAWMPTIWVGDQIGLNVIAPLYSNAAKRVALEAPIHCLLDRGRRMGKLLLRRTLYERGLVDIALREKTPVTLGSGSQKYLEEITMKSIKHVKGKLVEKKLEYKPSDPVQLYLGWLMIENNIEPPKKCEDSSKACPVCGRCLENGYCKFCGAYIPNNEIQ